MVIRSASGERVVDAEDYFIGPGTDITRMNVLNPGEILTAIRLPGDWAGSRFYFEKVRDRQVWDFALVSVASAMTLSGTTIQNMRIVVNGVAARPLRLASVEDLVRGKPRNERRQRLPGSWRSRRAAMRLNAYKIPLMRNPVKRAIRGGGMDYFLTWGRALGPADPDACVMESAVGIAFAGVASCSRTPATWCFGASEAAPAETDAMEAMRPNLPPRTRGIHWPRGCSTG